MTNNQIKYMIEVAETGSVNRAARNLYISQSALSNAIMSVEQEFGRRIFNRSSRGMTLTPFGKLFIAYITPIYQQLTQLYAMRNPNGINGSALTLNIISNGFYYISDIVAAIGRRNTSRGLRISLQEEYGGNVTDALLNGSADLGVVRVWNCYRERNLETFANMKLLYHPVTELQVGVDVSWHNPLYKTQEEDIAPEKLAPYPHIMHESLDFGPYADVLTRLHLPTESTRYVADSRAAMYELLDATDGYILNSRKFPVNGRSRADTRNRKWRFIPLRDCTIRSEIGWLVRENHVLSPEAREFVHMLKDYLVLDIIP